MEDQSLLDDIVYIHIQINETTSNERKILLPKFESVSQKIQIIGKSNAFVEFYKSLERHAELKNDIVIIGGRRFGKEKAAKYYAEDLLGRSLNTISCGVLDDNIINDFLVKNSLKTIKKRQENALFLHIAKENDFSIKKIVRSTRTTQSKVY